MSNLIPSHSVPDVSILLEPASPAPRDSNGSPSRLPRRIQTFPEGGHSSPDLRVKAFKRILVFCDGTWQDGISEHRSRYTNVLRLARAVNYEDERFHPSIPQIVFYQSGVGTENNLFSQYVEGTTGGSLADKVEEAYAFIAHNYNPGDEIFLFGFSRGAYTARMVSMFIGEIGVLDRKDMGHFASIFINFQLLGKGNSEEKVTADRFLVPWRSPDSKGRLRADIDQDKFTIKCLGVWDTVGALGLPKEFITLPRKSVHLFGFQDRSLGDHIEHAYQALALNEIRANFTCNKFIQSELGRRKKQTLKQCWFAGCHTDIGGGYVNHDLSDITLVWMAAQIENMLSLDVDFLKAHFQPVAPWGKQQPHNSATGIFFFADRIHRPLPEKPNDPETQETIHPSVLEQTHLGSRVSTLLEKHPEFISPLSSLEEQMKKLWPYDPNSVHAKEYADSEGVKEKKPVSPLRTRHMSISLVDGFKGLMRSVSKKGSVKRTASERGKARRSGNVAEPVNAAATTTATALALPPGISQHSRLSNK